jgi:ubiquinol-cytochrome c reductase cytochrome b subunit
VDWLGIAPSQFPGVLTMGIATLILFFLPWLDRSPVKSIRYRGVLYKSWLAAFVAVFLVLGYLGTENTNVWGQFHAREGSLLDAILDTKEIATWGARVCTVIYFAFFILMPWYTARDAVKPVPERVTV